MDPCSGNATLSFAASEDNSNCIPYEGLISAYLKRTDVQKVFLKSKNLRKNTLNSTLYFKGVACACA